MPREKPRGDGAGKGSRPSRGTGNLSEAAGERRALVKGRRRNRRARLLLLGLAALALVAGLVAIARSPFLAIRSVEVSGNRRLEPGEIERVSGVRGSGVITLDVEKARARVRELPLILDARVSKDIPRRRVRIDVVERSPGAGVRTGGEYVLVDRDGVGVEATATLPGGMFELTPGVLPVAVGERDQATGDLVHAGEVIASFSQSPLESAGFGPRGIVLVTTGGETIWIGDAGQLDEKGRAVRALQARAASEKVRVAYYDVTTPDAPAYMPR